MLFHEKDFISLFLMQPPATTQTHLIIFVINSCRYGYCSTESISSFSYFLWSSIINDTNKYEKLSEKKWFHRNDMNEWGRTTRWTECNLLTKDSFTLVTSKFISLNPNLWESFFFFVQKNENFTRTKMWKVIQIFDRQLTRLRDDNKFP